MTEARFIQIHWLASYPGTLLNRDDAGLAKRLSFGGAVRLRISSQAIKRRLRMAEDDYSLRAIPNAEIAERSKNIIGNLVLKGLAAETGKPQDLVDALQAPFERALYGEKGDKKDSRQALLIGYPEIRFLRREASRILSESTTAGEAKARAEAWGKEAKAVLRAMREQATLPGGVEAALFGRMVTSDPEANIDAAVHVAHALTVHAADTEIDYVTAVDDLPDEEDGSGAAGIFDAELTGGLYYGYIVVDVPALVANTTGRDRKAWSGDETDRTLAAEIVRRLIHLVATVSPGAKKGSTAPYAYADTVLVEAGSRQPRTLANAFMRPVEGRRSGRNSRPDMLADTHQELFRELADIDARFGGHESRRVMSSAPDARGLEKLALPALAEFAAQAVATGRL